MEAAGCEAWHPTEELAVRGFVEVLRICRELVRHARATSRARFSRRACRVFIGVDAPDFNLGLERRLKRAGVRTVHFVSPSVWAWRRERLADDGARRRPDARAVPVRAADLRGSRHAGDVRRPSARAGAAGAAHAPRRARDAEAERAAPLFALLPGSRLSEIEMHATLVLGAAAAIAERGPDARFVVPLVSRATRERSIDAQHRARPRCAAVDAALRPCGRCAACGRRRARGVGNGDARSRARAMSARHLLSRQRADGAHRRRKLLLPCVGLPNVLAGRFVVPELLQDHATPGNLAQAALNLFDDTITRHRLEMLFAKMSDALAMDTGRCGRRRARRARPRRRCAGARERAA